MGMSQYVPFHSGKLVLVRTSTKEQTSIYLSTYLPIDQPLLFSCCSIDYNTRWFMFDILVSDSLCFIILGLFAVLPAVLYIISRRMSAYSRSRSTSTDSLFEDATGEFDHLIVTTPRSSSSPPAASSSTSRRRPAKVTKRPKSPPSWITPEQAARAERRTTDSGAVYVYTTT